MSKTVLPPETRLDHIHLTVSDLPRSLDFYRERLGFRLHRQEGETAYLGAGRSDLLVLTARPSARQASGGTTGLYHFALLVPSRLVLAQALKHLGQTKTPLQGFSDHLVSEAIYLPDPDGNGIEIYRDRPREEWPYQNGRLQMATDPLDVQDLLAELAGHPEPWSDLPPETVLGHVHLHVAHTAEAEDFYRNIIGFELMVRYGPTASFLAAGGYHHHLGINTWAGVGAPPSSADAVGLRWYVIQLPDSTELNRVADRVRRAGITLQEHPHGLFLRDPAQNGLVLTA